MFNHICGWNIVLNDWVHEYSAMFFISPIKSFIIIPNVSMAIQPFSSVAQKCIYINYSTIYSTLKVIHFTEKGPKGQLAIVRLVVHSTPY